MTMIKHYIHTIRRHWLHLWAICLCTGMLAGGCSNDTEELPGSQEEEGPLLEVQLSTRALNGNGDLVTYPDTTTLVGTQHASKVVIYLFKGLDESAEYCGVAEDIGWSTHFMNNGGKLPNHTASMTYRLKTQLEKDTPYRFLAVGMNEDGSAAFDVPLEKSANGIKGTTLAEAIGQLKTTATASAIRRSEIYVGWEAYQPENHSATRITLRRRVAAVAGWFTNVPTQVLSPITAGVTDGKVTTLRISLYTAQNMALPLLTRKQKPDFEDYIPSAAKGDDATTLVKIEIPTGYNSTDTVSGGSFVLPVVAPADKEKYTLRIELLNAAGQILSVRRAKLPKDDSLDHGSTGGGTGIIDTESAFRFPIVANHYYGLGGPGKPIDLKGSGTDLTITVDPSWDEEADLELGEKN